jgi:hypothetical protein
MAIPEKPIVGASEEGRNHLVDLIEQQKALLASQQNLIAMQQHMLAKYLIKTGDQHIVSDVDLEGAIANPATSEKSNALGESSDSEGRNRKTIPSQTIAERERTFLEKYFLTTFLPVALGIIVLLLLFSAPRNSLELRGQLEATRQREAAELRAHTDEMSRSNDKIKELQSIVVDNQNALKQTQQALSQVEDELKVAQDRSVSENDSLTKPSSSVVTSQNIPVKVSNEEQLNEMLLKIAEIRKAIVHNNSDFLQTARSLAENRKGLAVAQAQFAARNTGSDTGAALLARKALDDYLPQAAKDLIATQTRESSQDIIIPKTVREAEIQIAILNRELLIAEKRLSDAEQELTMTQAQLRDLIKKLSIKTDAP